MLQVESGEVFCITRQLEDPTDSTTRYVQAKVYTPVDSSTAIDTVNLIDNGGQFFSKNYTIPNNPKGDGGYFLLIIIKVYDDSGYTTENTSRYERKQIELLVQTRWKYAFGAGSGGADVSYKKIREIVKEEMVKIPEPKPIKEVDLKPLLNAIKKAENRIDGIDIPKQKETDLKPLFEDLRAIKKEVRSINIPELPSLEPILQGLRENKQSISNKEVSIATSLENLKVTVEDFKKATNEIVKKITAQTEKPFTLSFPVTPNKVEKEEPKTGPKFKEYFKGKI